MGSRAGTAQNTCPVNRLILKRMDQNQKIMGGAASNRGGQNAGQGCIVQARKDESGGLTKTKSVMEFPRVLGKAERASKECKRSLADNHGC